MNKIVSCVVFSTKNKLLYCTVVLCVQCALAHYKDGHTCCLMLECSSPSQSTVLEGEGEREGRHW